MIEPDGPRSSRPAHEILSQVHVSALMTEHPVTLEASSTLADAADEIHGTARHTAYPVMHRGEPVGLLLLSSLVSTPHERWDTTSVAECMMLMASVPRVAPDQSGEQAMEMLERNPVRRAVVVDRHGGLVGILSLTDLARAVAARHAV
jgi:CBS domain-containing protein